MEKSEIREILKQKNRNFSVVFLVARKFKKIEKAKFEHINDNGFATFRRFSPIKEAKEFTKETGTFVICHEKGQGKFIEDISSFSLPISQITNLIPLD